MFRLDFNFLYYLVWNLTVYFYTESSKTSKTRGLYHMWCKHYRHFKISFAKSFFFFFLTRFFLENSCSHSSTESLLHTLLEMLQEWTWTCLSINHPESLLSDSSFTQESLECLCHSQYAGSVSILSGMCFTMTVSSKKLLLFCVRAYDRVCSSAEVW